MSQVDIVHLDQYRERRDARFQRTLALHGNDRERSAVLRHLWDALLLVGADRGAVVWLDEYGPRLAHPYALLDLACDRPRRFFSPVPLRRVWETGVPGLLDLPCPEAGPEGRSDGTASACAVALGSDGPRSWYLVLDSLTPRGALEERVAGDLMFLAGEVASVILHRDLARRRGAMEPECQEEPEGDEGQGAFAGWPVLRDLEGREGDDSEGQRIGNRFLVVRLLRGLVEDDLVVDSGSVGYQIKGVRRELSSSLDEGREGEIWNGILRAVEISDFQELVERSLEWGRYVEGQGHLHGALEILDLAYELAKATGWAEAATDAARFKGRIYRIQAEWSKAIFWYDRAGSVARKAKNKKKLAVVLDGLANTYRDRGNLPRARDILLEVMALALEEEDRYTLAIAHHDLMTVEKLRGDLAAAIRHGWEAVNAYGSREERLQALFDLAGVLRERGELTAARDGYTVVAEGATGFEYRLLSLDALALIAALRGEGSEHDRMRRRMEEEGWSDLTPVYRGQVLFFRGLSNRALGRHEASARWLGDALAFAEKHRLNKLIFDAEAALRDDTYLPSLPETSPAGAGSDSPGEGIGGVRQGLRELRETLAGVDGSP